MRIIKLVAENVKRLHAVSITPDGALITIGGKNGAGKSSVLDSIAYAMGGEKLVPSEPIRTGESEAKIVVDLGDLVVTRKFKRNKITHYGDQLDAQGNAIATGESWSDTTSTLTVTNKDGARYPSPQAVLDKLLGRLTFDPLAFARAEPKEQDKVLRKLVGLDVTLIEARRKAAFDQRAMLKKTHAIKKAQLQALPFHKDAPAAEVSMDEVSKEMLEAERLRKVADEAERAVSVAVDKVKAFEALADKAADRINRIKTELAQEEANLASAQNGGFTALESAGKARTVAIEARTAVPDVAVIHQKLTDVEAANGKVRVNQKHKDMTFEVDQIDAQIHRAGEEVKAADENKRAALAAATFPVTGLGLSDDGVTFNDLPFAQAGSAEQVRVSVAIGIALNPQLKVLLIRNGNLLDEDSLKAVAAQAEAAEMQVWMEWVSATKDGVAVMLVDGEVA